MIFGINEKHIVHHGVEGIAMVGLTTLAWKDPIASCAAYAAGKLSYLGTKFLLRSVCSKGPARTIAWIVALIAGGATLYKMTQKSIDLWKAYAGTLGVTAVSLGIRYLADKSFKAYMKSKH